MTASLKDYELVTPESLAEVLDDLAIHPGSRPFAGGTDLMVLLEAGHLPAGRYVSLANCAELRGITRIEAGGLPGHGSLGGGVAIGALTTFTEIRESAAIDAGFGMLKLAASETGGVATQNHGTIGGNIANASPAADTPPVLLAYDAELDLLSTAGVRRVSYASFHRGYKQLDLRPGEIIARVTIPPRLHPLNPLNSYRDYYRKVGTRRAQAISKVCFAGSILMDGDQIVDIRIALGSVAPTVIRATAAEAALRGRTLDAQTIDAAVDALTSVIAPIDDIRSTARYRTRVAANLLREFLTP